MPTNLAENALAALKVGNDNVTAAYVGNSQIFPNVTELTSWTGQNGTYNYSNTGAVVGTYSTSITGPAGATFDLVGTNGAIGQSGLVKAVDGAESFGYGVSSNTACDAAQRTISLGITPTGNTTLASPFGGRPNPDAGGSGVQPALQYGSPYATQTITPSGSFATPTEIQKNTVACGNNTCFAAGTIYDFTFTTGTITNNSGTKGVGAYSFSVQPTGAAGFAATVSNRNNTMGLNNPSPGAGPTDIYYSGGNNITAANQSNKSFTWRYEITNSSGYQPLAISYRNYYYDIGLTGNGGCYNITPDIGPQNYIYP